MINILSGTYSTTTNVSKFECQECPVGKYAPATPPPVTDTGGTRADTVTSVAALDYTGSIVVTASNEDREAILAYNNKVGAKNMWCAGWSAGTSVGGITNVYGAGEWTQIQLPAAQYVTKYRMWIVNANELPIEWTIQGSNDGVTYTQIDSKAYASHTAAGHIYLGTTDHHVDMTDPPQPFSEFYIASPGSYKYLKLIVGKSDRSAGVCISQLQYWGTDPSNAPPPPPPVQVFVSNSLMLNRSMTSCLECPPGTYNDRPGSYNCTYCPRGR